MDRHRYSVCVCLVILCCFDVGALDKEKCDNCVPAEQCRTYTELNEKEKVKWRDRFVCGPAQKGDKPPVGFSSTAIGDPVCCPENVWGAQIPNQGADTGDDKNQTEQDLDKRGAFSKPNSENNNFNLDNEDTDVDYEANRGPVWQRPGQGIQNPYFLPANQNSNNYGSNSRGQNFGGSNSRGQSFGSNSGGQNFGGNFNGLNSGSSTKGQCPLTSFPPDPATGCCGLEASGEDEINSQPSSTGQSQNNNGWNNWMPRVNNWIPSWFGDENSRRKRQANASVEIDNRIAGGSETDLDQFPWTVLLKTTFAYPTKDVAFACGGSLISSKYVLTAGHCVYDAEGGVKTIEITLAEYDKRTFPRDCKTQLGRGEVCVENIVMQAEQYTLHPNYNDDRLFNDIALVRLRGNAPYNNYIRPICLPSIDVDSPDLSNLRLAVAGWGRNGDYKSDIKQSTVVNLVPQSECRKSYPQLTRKQLCAAGYSGEDTCKGDSGGPLMMKYNGKYYLSGVVSGKRADAPCGTSVPSLYTNVYQYVPWIRCNAFSLSILTIL